MTKLFRSFKKTVLDFIRSIFESETKKFIDAKREPPLSADDIRIEPLRIRRSYEKI